MAERRRYFLLVRFWGEPTSLKARIKRSGPGVLAIVKSMSRDDYQLAVTSGDGGTMGFVLGAGLTAKAIKNRLLSPDQFGEKMPMGSPLEREDAILVIEVGELFDAEGLGKALTWLQRH